MCVYVFVYGGMCMCVYGSIRKCVYGVLVIRRVGGRNLRVLL